MYPRRQLPYDRTLPLSVCRLINSTFVYVVTLLTDALGNSHSLKEERGTCTQAGNAAKTANCRCQRLFICGSRLLTRQQVALVWIIQNQ